VETLPRTEMTSRSATLTDRIRGAVDRRRL